MSIFDELQARFRSNPWNESGKRLGLSRGTPAPSYDLDRMRQRDKDFQKEIDQALEEATAEPPAS